jgi:hypothetical protein
MLCSGFGIAHFDLRGTLRDTGIEIWSAACVVHCDLAHGKDRVDALLYRPKCTIPSDAAIL